MSFSKLIIDLEISLKKERDKTKLALDALKDIQSYCMNRACSIDAAEYAASMADQAIKQIEEAQ